jgi:hypothetical protein
VEALFERVIVELRLPGGDLFPERAHPEFSSTDIDPHRVRHGVLLDKEQCDRTLQHVAHLWGYRVKLIEVDAEYGKTLKEHETLPLPLR